MQFQIGDLVVLKSGGPAMVVQATGSGCEVQRFGPDTVDVVWFHDADARLRGVASIGAHPIYWSFHQGVLVFVETPEEG